MNNGILLKEDKERTMIADEKRGELKEKTIIAFTLNKECSIIQIHRLPRYLFLLKQSHTHAHNKSLKWSLKPTTSPSGATWRSRRR